MMTIRVYKNISRNLSKESKKLLYTLGFKKNITAKNIHYSDNIVSLYYKIFSNKYLFSRYLKICETCVEAYNALEENEELFEVVGINQYAYNFRVFATVDLFSRHLNVCENGTKLKMIENNHKYLSYKTQPNFI